MLQCRAGSGDSFIPVQLAWPSTPPRPLEQWCQGFYCPTPGLGPSAVPSRCLRDLSARLRRRGKGREEGEEPNGAARSQSTLVPALLPTCCLSTVPGGLGPCSQLLWMPGDQCSSYLWLAGTGTRGCCSCCLGSSITHQGCACPSSQGSPKIRAGEGARRALLGWPWHCSSAQRALLPSWCV